MAGQCDSGGQYKPSAADAAGELGILLNSLDVLLQFALQRDELQPVAACHSTKGGGTIQCDAGAATLPAVGATATPAVASAAAASAADSLCWGFEALQCSIASSKHCDLTCHLAVSWPGLPAHYCRRELSLRIVVTTPKPPKFAADLALISRRRTRSWRTA